MNPEPLNQRPSGRRKGQHIARRAADAAWWASVGLWPRREFALLAALVVAASAIWGFAELAEEVLEGETHAFDERVLLALRSAGDLSDPLGPGWVEELMRDLTALGSMGLLTIITLAVAAFLALDRKTHAALFVLVAVGGGVLLSTLLKIGFDRPRPDLVPHGSTVYTASFPSGHAMLAAVVYLTLGALLARVQPRRLLKLYLLGLAILLTVAVGASRVYLGVHWPTDVVAGWAIGAAWALLCWAAALWLQRRGQVEPPGPDPDTVAPATADGRRATSRALMPYQGDAEAAMERRMLPFLDEHQVRAHLHWDALIAAMENALIDFSAGRVQQPVRRFLTIERYEGFFGIMPAASETVMGIKLVTFYPGNAARGLPTHLAMIQLFSPQTGEALALIDGRLITEMRTAAVSAAATKVLAAPDAETLAILGSGVQARAHVEALRRVRDFREIRVWGRTREHAERFASEVGGSLMAAADAVRGADVIVTATAATEPILQGAWLKPGAHVNAIGWRGHASRELDDAAMRNVVVVESREAALDQCGDVILSGAKIHAELGEILAGDKPARADETTIFDSVGIAIEDIAAARLVYEAARGGQA